MLERTRDTVAVETPAAWATCFMVAMVFLLARKDYWIRYRHARFGLRDHDSYDIDLQNIILLTAPRPAPKLQVYVIDYTLERKGLPYDRNSDHKSSY